MTTGMSHETSSSSSSRSGRITNGVYRPLSTSSSNEIELQDRHSFSRTTADTSTAPSAPSQTPVANTGEGTMTSNAANQTKYLCCGGCRQWLSCPFDAELVYCPTCQSVNSCPRPVCFRFNFIYFTNILIDYFMFCLTSFDRLRLVLKLAIEMPTEIWSRRNHLNGMHRYCHL